MRSATYGSTRPAGSTLTERQWRGLLRLGDAVIPGDADLPAFSASGCAGEIERMLPYMYAGDRASFLALCTAAAALPRVGLRALVAATGAAEQAGPLAPTLRLAAIGIKGVIMSLYWSDLGTAGVHAATGYRTHIETREPEPNAATLAAATMPPTGRGGTPSTRRR